MSIEKADVFNDITQELRTELEKKVAAFGKVVRFKFKIEQPNPDPEKRDGATIFPMMYTLDPLTFTIIDPYEKGRSRNKRIGLVKTLDKDGKPESFSRIQVFRGQRGVLELYLDREEDKQKAMYLLMHPKVEDGMFQDKERLPVVSVIDEKKHAEEKRTERSLKVKALSAAQGFSDSEVVKFAKAMSWDATQDVEVLRSQVEDLAEYEPDYFMTLVDEDGEKQVEVLADIQSAVDNRIIQFDAVEYKYSWVGNKQVIAVLPPDGEKSEKQKLADYLIGGGDKANETYKKIKALLK